ncbi:MAG: glycine oxidase ThiO [Gloeomargaritaceae cyanobacterium C42_A2020_066]|nr:glycine oxidase ThiO [Gloeomargaritaceae cyanobacterium C42_A2020_066]
MERRSPDVLILGGGLMGLAIAWELAEQGARVQVLGRNLQEAAGRAAAGMLAPEAEGLPPGPFLELALASRQMYGNWVAKLEALTGESVDYWPCGILKPVCGNSPVEDMGPGQSLRPEVEILQPGLGPGVVAAHWYPQDGQVDNRRLVAALDQGCRLRGVALQTGEAHRLVVEDDRVVAVETSAGRMEADQIVLTAGAWCRTLLNIPVFPRKGQMLALRPPQGVSGLGRVVFGRAYLVPRRDGRLVIGATSEDVGFTPGLTPAGLGYLLQEAQWLYPALADWTVEECWWGYRPTTPDELPILGPSPYENLVLATGHYRNGVLLAPITAQLIAEGLVRRRPHPQLAAFRWNRFSAPAP